MGRAPCCDKNGLKKGPWTPEEDQKLIGYIQTHGPGNWRALPKNAGLQRCGKSCRLRWTNYLRPDIKRGRFSFEEEEAIIQLHSGLGNKWSAIAARLPGRTDNEIKNYWNTHIRKRLLKMGIDPVTHSPRLDLLDVSSILRTALLGNSSLLNLQGLLGAQALMSPELLNFISTLLSMKNADINLASQNLQQIQTQVAQQQQFTQFQMPIQANVESFPSNMTNINMSCSNSPESSVPPHNISYDNLTPLQNQVDLLGDLDFVQSLNNMDGNLGYDHSVLSTPLSTSSQTPLNSSSTYMNNSTDQERDSYCSNLFKFEIPESLDISDFL